jgi:hypothetical protein
VVASCRVRFVPVRGCCCGGRRSRLLFLTAGVYNLNCVNQACGWSFL